MTELIERFKDYMDSMSDISNDPIITRRLLDAMYYLQKYTSVDDSNVEDETAYNRNQQSLIVFVAIYFMYQREVNRMRTGNSAGELPTGSLKRMKADVVEIEYEGDSGKLNLEKTLMQWKLMACQQAALMDYALPLCSDPEERDGPRPPFQFIQTVK